jgi:cobalt-zinc-cadmium resistance protein CzcA
MFGLSVVTLVFEDDVDDSYARQQITALLPNIQMPEGADEELTPPTVPQMRSSGTPCIRP